MIARLHDADIHRRGDGLGGGRARHVEASLESVEAGDPEHTGVWFGEAAGVIEHVGLFADGKFGGAVSVPNRDEFGALADRHREGHGAVALPDLRSQT